MITQAFILAGGEGTRLGCTEYKPKPLYTVPEDGDPVLGHILRQLQDDGIDRLLVSVGFGRAAIENYLVDFKGRFEIEYVDSSETPVSSILDARSYLDDRFLLILADIYSDIDLKAVGGVLSGEMIYSLAIRYYQGDTTGFGIVDFNEGKLVFKPQKSYSQGSAWVDTGMWAASKGFLDLVGEVKCHNKARELAFQSEVVAIHRHNNGYWFSIDTPEIYQGACRFARECKG